MTPLAIGVLAAGSWALAALGFQFARMRAYGPRIYFAAPAGSARRGVFYAFGAGMSPTAKESAREHPVVYLTGISYHLGIFTAAAWLALLLVDPTARGGAFAGADLVIAAIRILTLLGALAGVSLLVRRIATPNLRRLSRPDDYLSNLLATGFTALACARTFAPAIEPLFFAGAMALLFYLPVGKIRHCFFFFTTRYHLGVLFGRRGTFPPAH